MDDTKRSAWTAFIDALRAVLTNGADISVLEEAMARPFHDIVTTIRDIAAAAPAPEDAFLNDDPGRRTDQMSLDTWCDALADAFVQQYTGQPLAQGVAVNSAQIASALKLAFKAMKPLIDPETFVRYSYQLRQHLDPTQVAQTLGKSLVAAVETAHLVDQLQWPPEVPTSDDIKEEEDPADSPVPLVPTDWMKQISKALASVPGGGSSTALGNRVHRAVMVNYRGGGVLGPNPHTEHLVVLDGRCWIKADVTAAAPLDDPSGLDPVQRARLQRFKTTMISPKTGKRIRPDIADLADAPSQESDDWGWFEIKPFKSLATGLEEIWLYYLPLYNVAVPPGEQAVWGTWFPPLLYLDRKGLSAQDPRPVLCVCFNVMGCIPYLVYPVESIELLLVAEILVALFNAFADQLFKDLAKLGKSVGLAVAEVATVIALVAAILFVVCFAILALAEVVVIGAAVIGELAIILAGLGSTLIPILQRIAPATAGP